MMTPAQSWTSTPKLAPRPALQVLDDVCAIFLCGVIAAFAIALFSGAGL